MMTNGAEQLIGFGLRELTDSEKSLKTLVIECYTI